MVINGKIKKNEEEEVAKQEYFKNALSNFTYEAASGGAIRHLADLGYTVKQIAEKLSFPTPYERIQKTVWEHFLNTHVVLEEEPGNGAGREAAVYVREYDAYGRASFRRVASAMDGKQAAVCWKERKFDKENDGRLAVYLKRQCDWAGKGKSASAYVSCDFGLDVRREKGKLSERLAALDEGQRDYISGLPWEEKRVYHRLDARMQGIIAALYENKAYHGVCYFIETEEKLIIE